MTRILIFFIFLNVSAHAQTREPWIDLPTAKWPVIALVNEVQFKNGDRYVHPSFNYAGTGFLVNTGRDTVAATAKHILWIAKNNRSSAVELNRDLLTWKMHPKGNTTDLAIMDSLLNEDSTEALEGKKSTILERDWIVMSVRSASPNIRPLKIRTAPLKKGEKVYIISAAYQDSTTKIYTGSIYKKLGLDILIDRDIRDHLPGSSGSPVIDSNGYLIGVISSSSTDGETGKAVSVAISTEYLQDALLGKKDLNLAKKDYGEVILNTTLKKGSAAAIRQYYELIKDPKNYYRYNLRSADRNGLREAGEKLLELGKTKEAIEILELNIKMNKAFYLNYEVLAKAYEKSGDMKKAEEYRRVAEEKEKGKSF